jgi:hypothetical protein
MKTTLNGVAAIIALGIVVAGGRSSSAQEKQDNVVCNQGLCFLLLPGAPSLPSAAQ